MNKIADKQVICELLMEHAAADRDLVVLCSDSRGSSSMTPFTQAFPQQFVETGIAEQNLVSIAAGLARCGKKPWVASPACFLSTRSMEQVKVDVAYSGGNVKLLGVSGGVSYGALGMTHHSANDIAVMSSIPNLRVYLPSDRHLTRALTKALLKDEGPAYLRVGRNAVEDVYDEAFSFTMDRALTVRPGNDLTIIACGELVGAAKEASILLEAEGISCRVLDMYCIKPLDEEAVLKAARETGTILTIEEHSRIGGLGAAVASLTAQNNPCHVVPLSLPDEPVLAGNSREVFAHYGLTAQNLVKVARAVLEGKRT